MSLLAQREGFEPPDSCPSTVFKTAAFDRSAISAKVFCISIQIIFLLGQLTPSAKYKLNGLTRLATQQSLIRHYVPHKTAAFDRSAISAKVFFKFYAILSDARAVVNQIYSRALRFDKAKTRFNKAKQLRQTQNKTKSKSKYSIKTLAYGFFSRLYCSPTSRSKEKLLFIASILPVEK